MSLVTEILSYFIRKEEGEKLSAPEGVCPNCWGEQEYDGVVREMMQDKQVDVNAGRDKHAFIQDFVVKHVAGIALKNTVHGMQCPRCEKVG